MNEVSAGQRAGGGELLFCGGAEIAALPPPRRVLEEIHPFLLSPRDIFWGLSARWEGAPTVVVPPPPKRWGEPRSGGGGERQRAAVPGCCVPSSSPLLLLLPPSDPSPFLSSRCDPPRPDSARSVPCPHSQRRAGSVHADRWAFPYYFTFFFFFLPPSSF